jgi:ABC-type transport system involved in cytochrome c biogenesis ATPase subunit
MNFIKPMLSFFFACMVSNRLSGENGGCKTSLLRIPVSVPLMHRVTKIVRSLR